MYEYVEGEVRLRSAARIVIDVAGVGYDLMTPPGLPFAREGRTRVWTHLAVREDDYEQKVAIKRSLASVWSSELQTRFVTEKAVSMGLKVILVVNKIDRDGCDPHGAVDLTFDLLSSVGATDEQMEWAEDDVERLGLLNLEELVGKKVKPNNR